MFQRPSSKPTTLLPCRQLSFLIYSPCRTLVSITALTSLPSFPSAVAWMYPSSAVIILSAAISIPTAGRNLSRRILQRGATPLFLPYSAAASPISPSRLLPSISIIPMARGWVPPSSWFAAMSILPGWNSRACCICREQRRFWAVLSLPSPHQSAPYSLNVSLAHHGPPRWSI